MKIIDQSHKILPEVWKLSEMTKRIERVARVCYQSEGKIKPGSDEKLCRKLIERKHDPMLEHAVIVLEVAPGTYWDFNKVPIEIRKYMGVTSYEDRCIVSASIRIWRDLWQINNSLLIEHIIQKLAQKLPIFFEDIQFNNLILLKYSTPITIIDPVSLSPIEQLTHRFISVKFITNRGVTHEGVRHRPASYAQESTRYVKYNGDTEFIRPVFDWAASLGDEGIGTFPFSIWCDAMWNCEKTYKALLNAGCLPQEARGVLPIDLKTEIVVTANIQEWQHIFKMRTAKTAHPQIRALMIPVLEELKKTVPILFDDIEIEEK